MDGITKSKKHCIKKLHFGGVQTPKPHISMSPLSNDASYHFLFFDAVALKSGRIIGGHMMSMLNTIQNSYKN